MKTIDEGYKRFWDDRYKDPVYAYGKNPNLFFKEQLEQLTAGTILLPADGEGRNGVYAAQKGWQVTALDLSQEAKNKALQLAVERKVAINYLVGDLEELNLDKTSFDVIALIYAHFPAAQKSALHKKLDTYLKPGGTIIFEAFSKKHLELVLSNPQVGGPKDIAMLFSNEELEKDFAQYEIILLEEKEIMLNEGDCHIGNGSVIRFVGRKPLG